MAHDAPTSTRSPVFYAALAVAVLCVAAIAFIAIRAAATPPSEGEGARPDEDAFAGGLQEDLRGGGGGAKGLHIQMMDRDERDRVAAVLESETIDPLQAQRYRVTQPRATMYLDDGRILRLTAEGGTLVMPDRSKPPETGTLVGNVLLKVYEAGVEAEAIAAGTADPSLTWSGSALTFDSTLGEVSTNEPFVLTSAQFEFRASDAKLLINQTLERLERFTVRKGGTLLYFADAESADPEPASAPDTAKSDRPPAPAREQAGTEVVGADAPAAPPVPPVVTHYYAAMGGGVRLERAGQFIESDRLHVFTRTIDNKLPPGAIAPVEIESAESNPAETEGAAQDPAEVGEPRDGSRAESPASPGARGGGPDAEPQAPALPELSADTRLAWSGVLEIRPLNDAPPELAQDDVFARFTAEESGVVRFADTVAGDASGEAALVEYATTTRRLILSGPAQQNVSLRTAEMGEARMSRLELDLASGEAPVPGPLSLLSADGVSRVDCRERAHLRFGVHRGRMTGELVEATLVGSARATDGEGWIEADELRAWFDESIDGESLLRRLVATTGVRLSDGRGGEGAWGRLEVAFAEDGQTPTSVDAAGGGHFRGPTERVEAEQLFAQLRRTDGDGIEVVKAWAEGGVRLRRQTDQIDIEGDKLFADADRQYLEVERGGGGARVARGATEIIGEIIRLHGVDRAAEVRGVGSFSHRSGADAAASSVVASWTEGMAFDDRAGRLECLGDVEATHQPDAVTVDTISAHALRVELAPASEASEAASVDGALTVEEDTEREIRHVYAAGPAYFGLGDGLATIESATYASPETEGVERTLEEGFRLSGVEIFADNQAQTLRVPGRGRLFVADLRSQQEGREDRGAALFDWRGSMHADRSAGTGEMLEDVQMSHTDVSSGAKTVLECEQLVAAFSPADDEESPFGGLRSAIARTDVYLRSDRRELTADLLRYDPDSGVAEALAEGGSRVRVLDMQTGSPMTAAAVVWNLRTDRIEIVDPGAITIPR